MSYLGEKVFIPDYSVPLSTINPNSHKFARTSCYAFSGVDKPVNLNFIADKRALYKDIIKGKQRVTELKRVLEKQGKL